MRTQTDDGAWTFHSAELCEHNCCEMGNVLIYNETVQRFDVGCWTLDDWQEFCSDDFDRMCNAEMLTEIGA